jgi:hypothetical protein
VAGRLLGFGDEIIMNDKNWEEIYEAILKDIVYVIEGNREDYEKVEFITSILVSNDFMEKPPLYS